MFKIYDDLSIHATRGDMVSFTVTAEENGESYVFQPGDVLRLKVFEKKNCANVVLQKEFAVMQASQSVAVELTGRDTKIGGVISRPVDYWYEIELNPFTQPRTIVGYDCGGPKIFRLLPEGKDLPQDETEEADIPAVDNELDLTSPRPVQNQAISRSLLGKLSLSGGTMTGSISMGGHRITGLGEPAYEGDAVNFGVMNSALALKAPAGYGLGTAGAIISNCDDARVNGFYRAPYPAETGIYTTGNMRVDAYSETFFTQTFYAPMGNNYDMPYTLIRTYNGTSFSPWEWVNPPMIPGIEYRTTERWNGKAVWTALVDCGAAVNPKLAIQTDFRCTDIIRWSGRVGGFALPHIETSLSDSYAGWANAFNWNNCVLIRVYAGVNMVGEPAFIRVWYTKD